MSVSSAKWLLGKPGITRPATLPPWQEKQFMIQLPLVIEDVLQRPWTPAARRERQPVAGEGHLAALVDRGFGGLGAERLLPRLPQIVEHLLIEVRREIRLRRQQPIASLSGRLPLCRWGLAGYDK